MRKLLNWRSGALLGWILITVLIMVSMPDMDLLVREKGQAEVPASTQSEMAKKMVSEMNEGGENYDIIAVFNSDSSAALSPAQKEQIASTIKNLQNKKAELDIKELITHLDNEQTEKQLSSEDGTTILTRISISKEAGTISQVAEKIEQTISLEGIKTYLTGTDLVIEDFVQSTQKGIQKTEVIAIVFILVVLVIVFRSPVVPLISLGTVGVSYLVSMGVIAQLVDHFDYPFSNFTQVFLVVILFGIGTDYNILLYTRFKEELSRTDNTLSALKETFRTAGKTVLYSGVAVLIGFFALYFAEFKIYRSSSAVAIGVAILLLVLNTMNPFFMALLGKKMFWPSKKFEGHGDSRLWGLMSKHAVLRPILFLVVSLALCVPFVIQYTGTLSYNDLLEIDDSYKSKQGINLIENHFPAGFSSPASIIIQTDREMNNPEDLQAVDELAETATKVKGIASVYTVTRPEGEKLNALYINDQTHKVYSGLQEATDGIGKINNGITDAESEFSSNEDATNGLQKLVEGTNTAQSGAVALGDAVDQLNIGIKNGEMGAAELEQGLNSVNGKLGELNNVTNQLYTGYTQLEVGLRSFSDSFSKIAQAIEGARTGYEQIETAMNSFVQTHPEMATDKNVQTTLGIATAGKKQLAELSIQLNQLVPQYTTSLDSFKQANDGLQQVNGGMTQLQQGIVSLQTGASNLETGLQKASNGSGQIAGKSKELAAGFGQIQEGQKTLLAGLSELEGKMDTLKSGLQESSDGLKKISDGLNEAQDYLADLSKSNAASTFYIPQDVLESEDFQKSVDMYMSDDLKTVQMMVILDVNPYSKEAMEIVQELNNQVKASLQGSTLNGAQIAIGGKSSQNSDLQDIAGQDFTRTIILMLTGIGIVLMVITRSFWQPVFILASLLLSYGAALGISELVGTRILSVDNLGWNVPFFGFIMIVALGVDYSIFLMSRYREIKLDPVSSMVEAARNIGSVVISAAIILGGTFAALIPSGVLTLIEVAFVVIIGLVLLSFLLLPIFIPALVSIMEKLTGKNANKTSSSVE